MIRNYKQYIQKINKMKAINNEIDSLDEYSNELYYEIDSNQDLYIQGYSDSLKVNNKLKQEIDKCSIKIKKLSKKREKLCIEIREYEFKSN